MTYAMIDAYCASCPHPLVALLLAHSNLNCALPVADRPPVALMIISIAGQVHVTDTFTEPIGLDEHGVRELAAVGRTAVGEIADSWPT